MKRIVIGLAVIVVLLGGVLAIAPGFVDWSKYKPEIISRLHDATGYDLAINGALSLRTLPSPHLLVENLSVTSPAGGKEPLLVLDRAEVSVALFPLLSGRVVVDKVSLLKPQIRLEVAADGTPSWTPPAGAKTATPAVAPGSATASSQQQAAGGAGNAVSLNDVDIEDGSFVYTDHRSGKTYALDKVNMSLHGDTLSGPFSANGGFVYGGQDIKLSVKSGRAESGADSVAIQAAAEIPGLSSKISYSGVVVIRGDHEAQGETDIDTASLKKLADFAAGGNVSPALDKPFSAKGTLTASPEKAAYQNLKFSFGGADFSGSAGVDNLKGDAAKPMAVDITLAADKPVDLTPFFPAAAAGPSGSDESENKPAGRVKTTAADALLLPASFTLPAGLTAAVNFSAPSVQYGDLKFKTFSLTGSWQNQKASGGIKAQLPGEGSFDTTFALSFGSASRAAAGGTVTLSDPALSYTVALKTSDGAKTAGIFVPKDKIKDVAPLLKGPLAVNISGEVKPAIASISKGALTLQDTTLALSGSYAPAKRGGRDALAITASADHIDLDRWMAVAAPVQEQEKLKSAPGAPAPSAAPSKAAIRDATGKLVLPFDLDLALSARSLHWKGADYNNVSLAGRLADKTLNLKTFQAQDQKGNNILAAGSVGDITALKDLDVSLQGKTSDLKKLLTGFDPQYASLPDTLKEAEVVAEFKGQADKMSFTSNAKAMGGTLDTTGTLAGLLDHPVVGGLTLRLKSPNYADIAKIFDPGFNGSATIGKRSLDIFGSMERKGDVYSFNNFQATVGPSTLSGDLSIDVSGARPSVTAKLQMGDVPLSQLIGHDSKADSAQAAAENGTAAATAPARTGHWSNTPIDADLLRKFDLDMTASVKSLSYGTWLLNNGDVAVTLKNGTVTVSKLTGGMYGGQVSLTGKLAASDKPHGPLTADGQVQLQNVALESFVASFSGSHQVKASGSVNVSADVKTAGGSPAALISALSGKGKADGKNLVFQGFDLAGLSRTLATPSSSVLGNITSALNSTMQGGSTSFDTLDSSFAIAQGIVAVNPLNLTGKDANVSSPGTVNLPQWKIDMEATITLATPKDAPPLKVQFKGPLDQPGKAFGQSALNSYLRANVQNQLKNVLQKNGILPGTPATTQPAAGQTAPTQKIKPRDLFNNVLKGVLQGR
jgi:uncharacterized protein involved in outer membrane biogenesis